jgi:hypothetical protein
MALMTETRTAPAMHIERDTYTGKHIVTGTHRTGVFQARELAVPGQIITVWESFGHVHGQAVYGRTRFVGQEDGSLAGYDSEGALKIIHPATRQIRVITN